ncbi:hypothetical protein QUV83_14290 [Cellulomonas cellasea]|uniref:hypothetical protein n=1 Tax=Cellulomonas cellasea TaxID=43670 RepID=UPI0025A32357|nr:hypothetical protein [Cellulomonas cellasea]MDM8085941.1 hypothetical protein [Cellulomonas cellasea]
MIPDRDLDRVLTVIRRSGVAKDLEDILRANPGGRPRRLSVEMLIAACVLAHGPKSASATLVRVHDLLTTDLTVSTQFRHGIAWRSGTSVRKLQIRQVRYLFKVITRALDYSPHTARADGEKLTQDQRIQREANFDTLVTRLVEASTQAAGTSEVVAIDASSMPSWSRRKGQVRTIKGEDYRLNDSTFVRYPTGAWDPDGRRGYQTPTHDKYDANRFFGFQMLTASTSFTPGSPEQPLKLITAMKLIPANAAVAGPALRMIDNLAAHQPLTEVIVDRGFSMSTHDHWADPVLARGLDQVFDLGKVQRGPVPEQQTGVLMIDGWPCAPWTPRHLHKIARPPRFAIKKPGPRANPTRVAEYEANRTALRVFQEAQAELDQYALVPNGRRKANGTRHFFAPTHRRDTATAAQRKKKVFKQATITLPATVLPHLRQRLRWGSPAWIAQWNRRNSVESGYGNLKTLDGEGVQRGWIRVVGLVAVGLMTTFAVIHYNLRMLRKWAATTGYTGDDIVLGPEPDVVGYEPVELHALQGAVEPPLAA